MSLRRRIMLLVTIGLIVATAPLGVMGIGMLRTATDRVLAERLVMARATAGHLNERLTQDLRQLDQLSRRIGLLWAADDLEGMRAAFATAAPSLGFFSGEIFLVDRAGRLILREPAAHPLQLPSPGALGGVRQTLVSGRPGITQIVQIPGETPAVIFSVPVPRGTVPAAGVIAGVILLPSPALQAFVDELVVGTTGHAEIVSDDGIVLASTEPDELFTRGEHPQTVARLIAERRGRVALADEPGPDGRPERHILAFAPLSVAPWGLTIGQDEVETFGPIRRLRDGVILFGLAVLTVALLFAWLDTGAVAAPLRVLKDAAEAIAGGDLGRKITVRRSDEVGTLGAAFERMRAQLLASLQENTRLQERIQSLAVLEERERIAREIHDSVGQVLGYVNTKAQAVQALLASGKSVEAQTQLAQLEQAAREVYADLREAILGLRPAAGPDRRLVTVLTEYVRRFSELSGVHTELVADGDPARYTLSPTAELHLLRIIQEALANVRKHAVAGRAWVRLTERDGVVTVSVRDDGLGFDPERLQSGVWPRFGLQTMRERAEAIGGTFTIQSGDGSGTEVVVRVPVTPGSSDARVAGG